MCFSIDHDTKSSLQDDPIPTEIDDWHINGFDSFNPLTGELVDSESSCDTGKIIWILIAGVGASHLDDEGFWYPCYDWCGRYAGSVLDGQYVDKSNIRRALIEMGWDPNYLVDA